MPNSRRWPFQSASALASGRCWNVNGWVCFYGFNPRPLSRADDIDLSTLKLTQTVSIRVRSRERTIRPLDCLLGLIGFQSASALASGRYRGLVDESGGFVVSIRVRSRERTIYAPIIAPVASSVSIRVRSRERTITRHIRRQRWHSSFNPRPLSRADDTCSGNDARGCKFQSASALASGRSDVPGIRWGFHLVSIRVRSRERTMSIWEHLAEDHQFQSASALASGRFLSLCPCALASLVSIRVRSRERTIGIELKEAYFEWFQSASALASGR